MTKSSIDVQSIKIFQNQQIIFKDLLKTTFIFKDFQNLEFAPLKFKDFPGPGWYWRQTAGVKGCPSHQESSGRQRKDEARPLVKGQCFVFPSVL